MLNNYTNKIILGSAQFGMNYGIANKIGQVQEREINDILNLAKSQNIDTIDTAKRYGSSEDNIGRYINNSNNSSWKIITKVHMEDGELKSQLFDSINKLSTTPYIILAHSASEYLDSTFREELHQLKDNTEIKKIGVSIYSIKEIKKILSVELPDVIQCPLNIIDTKLYHEGILEKIKSYNIEIHARSIFLQGLFYLNEHEIKIKFPDIYQTMKELHSIIQNSDLTLAELSLLWVLSLEQVDKVILGVDSLDQLKSHINTLNKKVDHIVYKKSLSISYDNENILNPSLWSKKL